MRRHPIFFVLLAALISGGFGLTGTAHAATYTVTKAEDTNDGTCDADCSLREAVRAANASAGDDTIALPANTYTLTINISGARNEDGAASGDLDVANNGSVTITGAGAANTIIQAGTTKTNGIDRVFQVLPSAYLLLSGVTVRNGLAQGTQFGGQTPWRGGGIYSQGALMVQNCVVSDNTAAEGGGISVAGGWCVVDSSTVSNNAATLSDFDNTFREGGGITVFTASLTVRSSTISGNSSHLNGGGICVEGFLGSVSATVFNSTISGNSTVVASASNGGAGICNNDAGSLSVINSTISGNATPGSGGGLFNSTINYATSSTVLNCTVTNNTAGAGGGFASYERHLDPVDEYDNPEQFPPGFVNLGSSIVAGNTGGGSPDIACKIVGQGYNLIGNTSGATLTGDSTGNITGAAGLDPLGNYGGPTQTHRLQSTSRAIDAGNNDRTPSVDQRGAPRLVDGPDADTTATADIGAYEYNGTPAGNTIVVTSNADTAPNGCTASDCTLREAINFANDIGGDDMIQVPAGTYTMAIAGAGEDGGNTGDLDVQGYGKLTLSGAGAATTIIQAGTDATNGIDRVFQVHGAELVLSGLTIRYGKVAGDGGGVLNSGGKLTLLNSALSSNTASNNGGGIYNNAGTATVQNSTLNSNVATTGGGGGVYNNGTVTVRNSTLSSNTATDGGGVFNKSGGSLATINTTFGSNAATIGSGGGIYNENRATASLGNTLLYQGTAAGANVNGAAVTSLGFNLNDDGTGPNTASDKVDLNLVLGPLADNGGPTLTHTLLAGTTAINGGSDSLATTAGLTTDQRGPGFPRFRGTVDIGALEYIGVTGVTSSAANGTYKAGDVISIQVLFNDVVNVTGTPQLTLETGTTDAVINYVSGSGTNTLTFNYVVGAGHSFTDLDYVSINALALNGGTIKDAAGANAGLILPTPGAPGSLGANKNLSTDSAGPVVTINQAPGQADPTTTSPIRFSLDINEAYNGFDASDIVVTGTAGATTATLEQVGTSATGIVYDILISGMVSNGTVIVTIPAGKFTDASGNPNTASTSTDNTVTYLGYNRAPVNSVPDTNAGVAGNQITTLEDTPLVFSNANGDPLTVSDADAGTATISVTISVTNGTFSKGGTVPGTVTVTSNGTASVGFSGPQADINTALNGSFFTPALNVNGAATLTMTSNDNGNSGLGGAKSDTQSLTINITPDNDAPVNSVPGAQSTAEDTPLVFSGAGKTLSVDDVDNATLSVTLSVSNGTLTLSSISGLSFTVGEGSDDATMTFSGTKADINAALIGLSYKPGPDYNGSDTLTLFSKDAAALTDSKTVAITVNAVNDAADLFGIETADLPYTENEAAKAITSTLTVRDIDSTNLTGATVKLTTNFAAGQDVLGYTTLNGITGNYNGTTGVLTLSGTATLAQYRDALRSVTYFNSSDNPSTATRTVSFRVDDGGSVDNLSNIATRTITLTATNDAPTLSPIEMAALPYTENEAAKPITAALVVEDVDSANLTGATVRLTTNFVTGQDILGFTTQNGITGSYVSATGILTLSGTATVAEYQTALRSVTYRNSSENPSTLTRTVSFQVKDDGPANSNTVTRTIAITAVNDAPTVTNNNGVTVDEGSANNVIAATRLKVDDVDNTSAQVTYKVTQIPAHGTLFKGAATLAVTSTFTQADIDAGNLLKYSHDGSETIADSFKFTVSDGAGGSIAETTFAITVTPVNDRPTVARALDDVSVDEDAPNTTINLRDFFADAEDGPNLTYTLTTNPSPTSVLSATIDNATDVLTLDYAANASGSLSITVTGSDKEGLGIPNTFQVVVAPQNDAPIVATNSVLTVGEDSANNVIGAGSLRVDDVDNTPAQLTYTVTKLPSNGTLFKGTTALVLKATFTQADINAGNLKYTHNGSETTSDEFKFTVSDGSGGSIPEATFAITVTTGNDTPTISTQLPDVAVDEDAPNSTINLRNFFADSEDGTDLAYTLTTNPADPTAVLSANIDNTTDVLTLDYASNASGTVSVTITAKDSGNLSVQDIFDVVVAPVNDAPTVTNNSGLTVTEGATADLIAANLRVDDVDNSATQLTYKVTQIPAHGTLFNGAALAVNGTFTQADINAGNLKYTHNGGETTSDSFKFTVSDGAGGSIAATTFAITVTPVNDRPTVSTPLNDVSVNEDAASTTINLRNFFADAEDGSNLAYTLATNPDPTNVLSASINNATDVLTLNYAANASGALSITVTGTDSGSLTIQDTFDVTVTAVNDAPVNSAPSAQVTTEDTAVAFTGASEIISVADVDNTTLALTLSVTNGTLTLADTTGLAFTNGDGADDATMSFSGTQGDLNFALDGLKFFPAKNVNGDATLTLVSSDGNLTDTDTVDITIEADNDAPVAVDAGVITLEDKAVTIDLRPLAGDLETADDNLTYTVVDAPLSSQGTVKAGATVGTLVFTPAPDFNGQSAFSYKVTDRGDPDGTSGNALDSPTKIITVRVPGVNDAPVAVGDTYDVAGGSLTVAPRGILANDSDIDGNALTAELVTDVAHGTLILTANGAFSYTADLGFNGVDSFTYRANDGAVNSNVVNVLLNATGTPSPTLTLAAVQRTIAEGAGTTVMLTRSGGTRSPLTVMLTSNSPQLSVPSSVTIAAGQASATFLVTAVDDNFVNGTRRFNVSASATATIGTALSITITDNDVAPGPQPTPTPTATPQAARMTLTFSPATFNENAGPAASVATLTRTGSQGEALTVRLGSTDTGEVQVPGSVTIPAGLASVTFPLTAVDDGKVDGDQRVTIRAMAARYPDVTGAVLVRDNGAGLVPLTLTLDKTSFTEGDGDHAATGTVSLAEPATENITVELVSSDTGEVRVASSVTIRAGTTSAAFLVSVVDDSEADGTHLASITARSSGHRSDSVDVRVLDNDERILVLTSERQSVPTGGSAVLILSSNLPLELGLTVNLSSSNPDVLAVPATATIKAGTRAVAIPVSALGTIPAAVKVTASKPSYASGEVTLQVNGAAVAAQTQVISAVKLSTAGVQSAMQSVMLRFTGPLNASQLDASNFTVQVGAATVTLEAVSYDEATFAVTLLLPEGTLRVGDTIDTTWRDLRDTKGATLSGHIALKAR